MHSTFKSKANAMYYLAKMKPKKYKVGLTATGYVLFEWGYTCIYGSKGWVEIDKLNFSDKSKKKYHILPGNIIVTEYTS